MVFQNQKEFVIGLEDELLAEAGEKKILEQSHLESSFSLTVGTSSIPLTFLPEKPLFEAKEIHETFKILATSANVSQKIEAMNKMMLLPLASESKIAILMKLLEENHPEILQSIFIHLAQFGLNPEILETYTLLQKETVWQTRSELIRRLGHLKNPGAPEKEILRKFLWTLLGSESHPQCLCAILETLSFPDLIQSSEVSRFVSRILAKLVEHLPNDTPNGHPHSNPHLFSLIDALRKLFADWRVFAGEELLVAGLEEMS